MPEKCTVNVPGCGDSLLSEHVALMGHSCVSFDFEPGVISKMKERKSAVDYQVGDMMKMHWETNSFEVVLDKGSFDALCIDDEEATRANVGLYCDGIKKIMKHAPNTDRNGGFILISLL